MEIKHKECFCPNIIRFWGLQAVSRYARQAVEFVNLYSKWRGVNRWPALIVALDLLREWPEVLARTEKIPDASKIREFIDSGLPLSDCGLQEFRAAHPAPELDQGLAWSIAVNKTIAEMVHGVPPFPFVRKSLEKLQAEADMVVISGTPKEALQREWLEHDIARFVRIIAGQEMGKKEEHLALAAKDKYPSDRILMVGDSPADLQAARANQALFFPVVAGREEKSWCRFYEEALDRFFKGTYAGDYENELVREFEEGLPAIPPWKK
jgi:phosphoglycolate phosphatase-like HAD superfamily hydrolase